MSMGNSSLVDVLIIGGSHAGLSAVLTLYRAQHTYLIFDCNAPRNHYETPVRLVSTWENKDLSTVKEDSKVELLTAGFAQFIDSCSGTGREEDRWYFRSNGWRGQ